MIWFCFRMNSVANLMIYKQFVRLQHVKTLKCRFYVISSHIKNTFRDKKALFPKTRKNTWLIVKNTRHIF